MTKFACGGSMGERNVGSGLKSVLLRIRDGVCGLIFSWRYPEVLRVKYDSRALAKLGSEGYRSQSGQDAFLVSALFPAANGPDYFFVDIGCNHPETYSNTIYFEREMNWSGIAIDALPLSRSWKARKAEFIQAAVGPGTGKLTLLVPTHQVKGIPSADMLSSVARYSSSKIRHAGEVRRLEVDQVSLKQLLKERGISYISLISCDVEGFENEALSSLDWEATQVDVVLVENDAVSFGSDKIRTLLKNKGMVFFARIEPSDDVFVSREVYAAWTDNK